MEGDMCVVSESVMQEKGHTERPLSQDEMIRLQCDTQLVCEFKRNKLEQDAKKNWDLFYRRNKNKFFKDRYWTFREFDELNENDEASNGTDPNEAAFFNKFDYKTLLEIGCGVGNFMYPLIKHNKRIFVHACDFSSDAIQLLRANPDYDPERCNGFVCDVTKLSSLRDALPAGTLVDAVTLIFVLSAIHPCKMRQAIENIAQIIRPGGLVMVRDYGVNDHSMIRFEPGHKLAEKFYARQDGTRTFFFSLEEINNLFLEPFNVTAAKSNELCSNIEPVSAVNTATADVSTELSNILAAPLFEREISEYVFRETVNFKEKLRVPRVFIQSKFVRNHVQLE